MQKIETALFFEKGSITKEILENLILKNLQLDVKYYKIYPLNSNSRKYDETKFLNEIDDFKQDLSIEFAEDKKMFDEKIWFRRQGNIHYESLHFYLENREVVYSFIEEFFDIPGFNACLISDKEFVGWESTSSIQQYEIFEKDYKKKRKRKVNGEKEIDIRYNYGRSSLFIGMLLMAAPKMYFNNSVHRFIPEDKLINFPYAKSIKKVKNEITEIILFDDILTSDTKENYSKLKSFRKWCSMDKLENNMYKYLKGYNFEDESMYASYGKDYLKSNNKNSFKRGGQTVFIAYLDKKNKNIKKVNAIKKYVSELDSEGVVIWRGMLSVNDEII